MLSRSLRALSRFIAHPGGEGMLSRVRAVSFAMLGLTAAVGLALVAFISQVGWPDVGGGPIPSLPAEQGVVHRQTLSPSPTVAAYVAAQATSKKASFAATSTNASVTPHVSAVSGSNEVEAQPPPKAHGGGSSGSGSGGGPTGQPQAPVPAPAPPPAPAAPAPSSTPVVASTHGSGKAWGRSKDEPPPSSDDGGGGGPSHGHGHGHAYGHYGR